MRFTPLRARYLQSSCRSSCSPCRREPRLKFPRRRTKCRRPRFLFVNLGVFFPLRPLTIAPEVFEERGTVFATTLRLAKVSAVASLHQGGDSGCGYYGNGDSDPFRRRVVFLRFARCSHSCSAWRQWRPSVLVSWRSPFLRFACVLARMCQARASFGAGSCGSGSALLNFHRKETQMADAQQAKAGITPRVQAGVCYRMGELKYARTKNDIRR